MNKIEATTPRQGGRLLPLVRRFEDWTKKDKENWSRIMVMRCNGWDMKRMTTGTRLKRFTVERLLNEYRAAHTPNAPTQAPPTQNLTNY